MSDIANALVHLHDRLAELMPEVKPKASPTAVVAWTKQDFDAVNVLVTAMWRNVSDPHAQLLREFAQRDRRTSD